MRNNEIVTWNRLELFGKLPEFMYHLLLNSHIIFWAILLYPNNNITDNNDINNSNNNK